MPFLHIISEYFDARAFPQKNKNKIIDLDRTGIWFFDERNLKCTLNIYERSVQLLSPNRLFGTTTTTTPLETPMA